jgi:hypothetical protein
MQAFLQSTLSAPTIFESWLPMDSESSIKGNCNARRDAAKLLIGFAGVGCGIPKAAMEALILVATLG